MINTFNRSASARVQIFVLTQSQAQSIGLRGTETQAERLLEENRKWVRQVLRLRTADTRIASISQSALLIRGGGAWMYNCRMPCQQRDAARSSSHHTPRKRNARQVTVTATGSCGCWLHRAAAAGCRRRPQYSRRVASPSATPSTPSAPQLW
jgi:hypothetical protein